MAGIAHEINNPLTGILLFASMIENNPHFSPEIRDDLTVIVKQANRCATIVRELNDEKIDVIEWDQDQKTFISKALSPARVSQVFLEDHPDSYNFV